MAVHWERKTFTFETSREAWNFSDVVNRRDRSLAGYPSLLPNEDGVYTVEVLVSYGEGEGDDSCSS